MVEQYQKANERFVFISHTSQDTWVAKQIAREIQARGATPFLDEANVEAGADFEEDILNFLEQADKLVLLLTPWALKRPHLTFLHEIKHGNKEQNPGSSRGTLDTAPHFARVP